MPLSTRVFAAAYDRVMARLEHDVLGEVRARMLAGLSGRVLEIGAGTGVNLAYYPDSVTELVLTEPDPHMCARLVARMPPRAALHRVGADALPFPDTSFDAVVVTLVLCTVPDPGAAIDEIRRVLRPGAPLVAIEHVRSDVVRVARWQDRLAGAWGWCAGGCQPNRATLDALDVGGFDTSGVAHRALGPQAALIRDLVWGELAVGAPAP